MHAIDHRYNSLNHLLSTEALNELMHTFGALGCPGAPPDTTDGDASPEQNDAWMLAFEAWAIGVLTCHLGRLGQDNHRST